MSKKNKDIIILDCGTKVTPFNLKKALRGDDVICRNGSGVSQLARFVFDNTELNEICGITEGDDSVSGWSELGGFNGCYGTSAWDLFMVYKEKPKKDKKVKTKRWVNVYNNGNDYEVRAMHLSKKEAKGMVADYAKNDGSYISTVKIKF